MPEGYGGDGRAERKGTDEAGPLLSTRLRLLSPSPLKPQNSSHLSLLHPFQKKPKVSLSPRGQTHLLKAVLPLYPPLSLHFGAIFSSKPPHYLPSLRAIRNGPTLNGTATALNYSYLVMGAFVGAAHIDGEDTGAPATPSTTNTAPPTLLFDW